MPPDVHFVNIRDTISILLAQWMLQMMVQLLQGWPVGQEALCVFQILIMDLMDIKTEHLTLALFIGNDTKHIV